MRREPRIGRQKPATPHRAQVDIPILYAAGIERVSLSLSCSLDCSSSGAATAAADDYHWRRRADALAAAHFFSLSLFYNLLYIKLSVSLSLHFLGARCVIRRAPGREEEDRIPGLRCALLAHETGTVLRAREASWRSKWNGATRKRESKHRRIKIVDMWITRKFFDVENNFFFVIFTWHLIEW